MKSRPTLLGSLREPKYTEFIVFAALALVGSAAIVVLLAKPANIPPLAEANSVATQEDTAKSITLAGSDEDGDQLTYAVIAGPAHGQLSGTAPDLTYNPEASFHGSDSFSFKVNDGQADSDVAVVSIEVESATPDTAGQTFSLTVTAVDGSVTKRPDRASYNHGETVTLEAVPNLGYRFSNWTGDLSGRTNPGELVMQADSSVTANFARQTYSLTVTAVDGSVTKSPDQASYNHGETVILQAVPDTGYRFSNWAGDMSGRTNPSALVMEADKSVTADFARQTYSLTVTAVDGSVTKSPDRASYNHGETVTLEAVPNTGYRFSSWTGDLSGRTNPSVLVMEADKLVTADFTPKAKASDSATTSIALKAKASDSVTTSFAVKARAGDVATNSIGMKLVYIPRGSFTMGSSRSAAQLAEEYGKEERRFAGEFPQHPVFISRGFWMGQTEVTQGQYQSVMNAQPWSGKAYVQEDANDPAVYVSWDDAAEFCRKLGQQEGKTYRLPTEAEWEYACRAGTTTRFCFGDDASALGDYAWFDGNADAVGQDYAHPVGQKKPNPWGMYDMHGNVLEWCSDYYDEKYYSNSPSVDPNGPSYGISRSLRGGSWDNGESYLRCSYRSDYPVSRGLLVGFRVVSDGEAGSDVAVVSTEVEPIADRPKAIDNRAKAQEDAPIAVKAPAKDTAPAGDKLAVADATQPAKDTAPDEDKLAVVEATPPAKGTAPAGDKLAVVDATQGAKDSVTIATDSTVTYDASGNVYDILDQAAVGARSGKVEQAQGALSSLLKDKDATVLAGYELGLIHYENGEVDKAVPFFKDALSAAFPGPPSGRDERALTALLNQEADAARIRYELALVCQSQGKQDQAAKLFRDSLSIISAKGATYIGVKKCKSCHFKQWNSWRKTKMAKTFEVLKPGIRSEEKTKLKFDPNKDYTRDTTCLGCHTSGFGLPGGYMVPADGDTDAQEQAADNAGVTCEGCHGPGSKSVEIQEDIKENKRPYTFAELRAVGFHKAGVRSCTPCHNASDPGKEPGYHFEYEERRKEGQHENVELKYRRD